MGQLFRVYQVRVKPQRNLLVNCLYGLSMHIVCVLYMNEKKKKKKGIL